MGMVKPKVACEISGACLGYIHSKRLVYVAPEKTSDTLTGGGRGLKTAGVYQMGVFQKVFPKRVHVQRPRTTKQPEAFRHWKRSRVVGLGLSVGEAEDDQ